MKLKDVIYMTLVEFIEMFGFPTLFIGILISATLLIVILIRMFVQ